MKAHRGMSLVDVIVGSALMLIIFMALFGLLRASLKVASLAKTRSIATAAAESRMEYIRSLSYDAVGTLGGIPPGALAQVATSTVNGVAISTRTLIEYVDDPKDGVGSLDTNGVTTDYKRIKVSVTYSISGTNRTVDLVSNYAPPGLETTVNGGTLKIVVVNASGVAVPGATVRIVNASTSPTVDLSTFSDATGIVFLPGAATSTQYQITVSKSGYSTAQTYARDATNQNPTPGYLTVALNQTTTGTFAIDLLSTFTVRTYTPIATSTWTDTFSGSSGIVSSSNTAVVGGALTLSGAPGTYQPAGTARATTTSPTYLSSWSSATATTTIPAGTSLRFHVADSSGGLLPDTALPGNATGFTGTVSLANIATTTYPSLSLVADLTTSSASTTPELLDWGITYRRGPVPLPSVPFTLTGAKAIGTTGAGASIYKTTVATSTDTSAVRPLSLEWDTYKLTLPGYDVADACSAPPYILSPGTTVDTALILATSTTNSLLVTASDGTVPVQGASVTLSRTGFSQTVSSSACGGASFSSLTSGNYNITVTKTGYTTFSASNIPVSGHAFYAVPLD